jgi:hypothetical protein
VEVPPRRDEMKSASKCRAPAKAPGQWPGSAHNLNIRPLVTPVPTARCGDLKGPPVLTIRHGDDNAVSRDRQFIIEKPSEQPEEHALMSPSSARACHSSAGYSCGSTVEEALRGEDRNLN